MPVWIGIATFVFTIAGSLIGAGWRAKGMQTALDKKISDNAAAHETKRLELAADLRADTERRFEAARIERSKQIDEQGRIYGDTVTALRTKINEVEASVTKEINGLGFWVRDHLVSRMDFQNIIDGLVRSVAGVSDDIKEVNRKLDSVIRGIKDDRDAHR
jgi:hypothetical protein